MGGTERREAADKRRGERKRGKVSLPGDIAAMNMPVRVPIRDWSFVICATHDDATERKEALAKPNLLTSSTVTRHVHG